MEAVNSKVYIRVGLGRRYGRTKDKTRTGYGRANPEGMNHVDLFDSVPARAHPDPHCRKS